MGTRVGRIVKDFILRSIVDAAIPIDISFHKRKALCRVAAVTDDSLELEVLDGSVQMLAKGDPVRVFLHFQNNHHAFEATCLGPAAESGGKPHIFISHPDSLYKNLQRKFERVRVPEGMEIYFMLQGRRVDLGFPRVRRELPPAPQSVSPPPEPLKLDGLIRAFRAEAANIYSTSRIVMFRERQPSGYEENAVSTLGSILWYPTIDEGLPETQPLPHVPVVTASDLRTYEAALGTPEDLVKGRIAQLGIAKRSQSVFAEATCPILHGEYVLGCIYVANLLPRRERIASEQVEHLWGFSQILSGVLERHRYIEEGAAGRRRYDAPIIDMSASGLLFCHPSEDLSMDLLINTDVQMNLVVEGRKLELLVRVRRKLSEPGQTYYGVQFAEIAPEDFSFLFEYLYGRLPAEEDDTQWEGGAPPPRVDLFGDQP